MDPGEGTTGTRDEQYALISVLYHALHGAENCNAYALDAEAAGDRQLIVFFREAGVMQARLAEQAKGMLGIREVPSEPGVRPGGSVPSGPADVRAGEPHPPARGVPPTTDVPRTALPDEDVVIPGKAPPSTARTATGPITSEDFDATISALEGDARLAIGRALAEIETWERKLEATGDPELESVAGNLGALRALLSADDIDVTAAGSLLTTLGEQVQGVAPSEVGAQVADKLQRLSELLTSEGRSLSG
ncbi:MAG TPA: hypothetical protein VE225_04070 [Rubrobacteraceae bacterium]|nr:hypothetical protein [Rubrobacteraceae bacterium]